MMFVRKTRAFYVDEIDTKRLSFRQTNAPLVNFNNFLWETYFANFLTPKKFKHKDLSTEN